MDGDPKVHELLSSYLDNEVDAEQFKEAEGLLANDLQAAEYLSQLRANRQSLIALRSSVAKVDIVSRVLSRIESNNIEFPGAALAQESPEPTQGIRPSGLQPASKLRLLWVALAGLAALVVLSVMIPQPRDPQGIIGQQPNGTSSGSQAQSPFDLAHSENLLDSTLPPDKQIGGSPVMGSENRSLAKEELRQSLQPQINLHMLLVLDVMVSSEAWDANRFTKALDEVGVPIASPILVGPEISALLMDSRVFKGDEANSVVDKDSGTPRAALVYLQAKGSVVDRLVHKLSAEKQNFPEVRIDIAIDPSDSLLAKILSSQKNQPVEGPSARVLVTAEEARSARELTPNFSPGPRRKGFAPSATRLPESESTASNSVLGEMNPASEVLIVLRKP